MSQPAAGYKGFIFLATFAVVAHCAIKPMFDASDDRDESDQFTDNEIDHNKYEPPTLHKRPSFFVGSRYGRSGSGTGLSSSKMRRLNIVPRNDRFFLGSRYGKRAEGNSAAELFSPYEQQTTDNDVKAANGSPLQHVGANKLADDEHDSLLENEHQQPQPTLKTPSMMSCVYSGFRNYYRCRNIDEINNIINQLTVAHSLEEMK